MYDPQTGLIDFSEGLKCLRNGKLIARLSWPTGMHIYLEDGLIYRRIARGFLEGWIPGLSDIPALDWYEVIDAEQK